MWRSNPATSGRNYRKPAAIGLLATIAIVGAAVALIVATARIVDNNAVAGEIQPPASGLQVAITELGTPCTDTALVYSDLLTGLFAGDQLTYPPVDGVVSTAQFELCIRSLEQQEVAVTAVSENVASTELGTNAERDALETEAGDTTDGTGELADGQLELRLDFITSSPADPNAGTSCTSSVFSLEPNGTGGIGALQPDETCRYGISLLDQRPPASQVVSSTDDVSFDLVFNAAVPDASGALVIHEIMANPAAVLDEDGEWIEVFNPGTTEVDLNGWVVSVSGTETTLTTGIVPAQGYYVFARDQDPSLNGGVPADQVLFGSLGNVTGEIALVDPTGATADAVIYESGTSGWPNVTSGQAFALTDPAVDNADGATWCLANTSYGDGDLGTPGAANDCSSQQSP